MSRRKTEQQLKLQLQYAEARKAYTPPKREEGESGKQRKSQKVRYDVMSRPTAEPLFYTIHAASNSITFFAEGALTELGLAVAAADGSPPRGFKPAKIHATKSTDEGTVKHAKDSGRPYMSYRPSGGQGSYSAPICSTEGVIGVVTKVKAITEAKKGSIGPYGRIWFTPEFYVIVD
ncbi:MAG: hypothetical protein V7L04_31745 [Nostoc sp.]|uniref:hypothetical protein n=1 Tax=Nostoc sp. TaxID=1180 RepID=UPI002FFCA549